MALKLEDGTAVAGADTYRELADILAFGTAYGISTTLWSAATVATQEGWARLSTVVLDSRWQDRFPGTKRTSTQGLLWPRGDAYDREGWPITFSVIPPQIQNAQSHLALLAANGTDIAADVSTAAQIEELRAASGAGIKFSAPISVKQFRAVEYHLKPILLSGGKWSKTPLTGQGVRTLQLVDV